MCHVLSIVAGHTRFYLLLFKLARAPRCLRQVVGKLLIVMLYKVAEDLRSLASLSQFVFVFAGGGVLFCCVLACLRLLLVVVACLLLLHKKIARLFLRAIFCYCLRFIVQRLLQVLYASVLVLAVACLQCSTMLALYCSLVYCVALLIFLYHLQNLTLAIYQRRCYIAP